MHGVDLFEPEDYEEINRVKGNDGVYQMSYLRRKTGHAMNLRDEIRKEMEAVGRPDRQESNSADIPYGITIAMKSDEKIR